ncbi:endonuclease domain-containing protein [Sphingomonas montanisoli]|uniref:Endonuclease domain-containing protein n=2 Tax=Sphingomonas montanisoli TaxID=2606412 RepID=A0A5D9CEB0_9SPHN|nr:endonuclease domain-containing protein [Sphingomonas montanisoli]TZG29677.1 endonuclease domain-containing protein [Sphingomonas montanisoli]
MLHGPKSTQTRSANFRQNMSLPEVLLWQELRKRPAGLRFRRQHPAGPYSLDFFCPRHRLAVEIDGEAHSRGDQPARDIQRDAWLRAQNLATLRIPAAEVLDDVEAVLHHIITCARGDYPSTGFAGPPPPPGEDR